MLIITSLIMARANFAALCSQVTGEHHTVIIHRLGCNDVALVSAAELASLLETVHLIKSPKNAQRLFKALNRALETRGETQANETLEARISRSKQRVR
jgi:antitoxin YefM